MGEGEGGGARNVGNEGGKRGRGSPVVSTPTVNNSQNYSDSDSLSLIVIWRFTSKLF